MVGVRIIIPTASLGLFKDDAKSRIAFLENREEIGGGTI
jgi:hypothetical protein